MSLPRYPKYKDSGVEWLGEVPEHWEVKRIGYYFDERREKVSDSEYQALSVTKAGIVPQLETAAKTADNDNRKKVCKGDFVINSRSDRNGSAGASDLDGSVSLISTVLRPREDVHSPFVHHLLRCQPFQQEFYRNGKGIVADLWTTNYGDMRNIIIAMPSLPEQIQVGAFLDREAAKIERLVVEQGRLVELLKEKRQAVISHAVTKGLNPHLPTKASNVEWIGDVPEHWSVRQVKYECRYESGHTPSKSEDKFWVEDECNIPWVSLNDTKRIDAADSIDDTTVKISPVGMENSSAHIIEEGAVVFTRDGARVGLATIIAKPMCVSQHIIAWVCGGNVYNYFLLHVMYAMNAELQRITAGSTIPTIGMPDVKRMVMPLPPLNEQHEVVDYLLEARMRFQSLIEQAERAIDLLQERRTALITAAVTGQIDVRNV